MEPIKLSKTNFNEVVAAATKPVLIDFYATWCGPCKMVSPVIDKISREHDEYVVCKVDVDQERELAYQFGISSIPALFVLKGGEIVNRAVGARSEADILAMLNV